MAVQNPPAEYKKSGRLLVTVVSLFSINEPNTKRHSTVHIIIHSLPYTVTHALPPPHAHSTCPCFDLYQPDMLFPAANS